MQIQIGNAADSDAQALNEQNRLSESRALRIALKDVRDRLGGLEVAEREKVCRGAWARVTLGDLDTRHSAALRSLGHLLIYSPTKC